MNITLIKEDLERFKAGEIKVEPNFSRDYGAINRLERYIFDNKK